VRDCRRLVLLGDVVELRQGPVSEALRAAAPALEALGGALPEGGEVVVVPGNHDHHLLDAWLARRDPAFPLELENAVQWQAEDPLATIADALAPARVRVSYPGVWLRDDVLALHGHFGDRHTTVPMLERLGAGGMARVVREPADGPRSVDDYERVLAPLYAWIHAIAQHGAGSTGASAGAWDALAGGRGGGDGRGGRGPGRAWRARARRGLLRAGLRGAIAGLNRAGLGPLHHGLHPFELRRAGLAAQAEVLGRLGVSAAHVVFGHTHRAGPLPDDDFPEWVTPTGTRLWNTGSWVHEPMFLGREPDRSPYRGGFAVELDAEGPPRLVNLLDGE
jgi:hypothetical protein